MKIRAAFALLCLKMSTGAWLYGAEGEPLWRDFAIQRPFLGGRDAAYEVQRLFYQWVCFGGITDGKKKQEVMLQSDVRFRRFTSRSHVLFFVSQEKRSGMQKVWPIVGQLLINTDTGSIDILAHIGSEKEKKMIRALLLAQAAKLDMVSRRLHHITCGPAVAWHTWWGFELIDSGLINDETVREQGALQEWLRYEVDQSVLAEQVAQEFPEISQYIIA